MHFSQCAGFFIIKGEQRYRQSMLCEAIERQRLMGLRMVGECKKKKKSLLSLQVPAKRPTPSWELLEHSTGTLSLYLF